MEHIDEWSKLPVEYKAMLFAKTNRIYGVWTMLIAVILSIYLAAAKNIIEASMVV